jgi:hyperosmotically inducible periplasmic protein
MKMQKGKIAVTGLSLMLGLSVLTACKHLPSNKPSDGRSEGRAKDDKNITGQVEKRLENEPVYKFGSVEVRTYNGIVQLSGFVDNEAQRRRAEEITRQVPGITQVANALILKQPGSPTPTGQATGERLYPPATTNSTTTTTDPATER